MGYCKWEHDLFLKVESFSWWCLSTEWPWMLMPVCLPSLISASWSDCQTQASDHTEQNRRIGRKMQATIFKSEKWNGLIKNALFIGKKNVALICGWHMIIRFLRISWICFATDITQMALALLNQESNFKIWYHRKRQANRPCLWVYSGPKNIPLQLHGWPVW